MKGAMSWIPWFLLHWAVIAQSIPVPEDCDSKPFTEGSSGGLWLKCHLSAINSAAEKTNFSVIPAEHTLGLTVKCGDLSSHSKLEPEGFKSLVWLEELSIVGCKLDKIPDNAFLGLTRLKGLTIKSENDGVLSITSKAFAGLANLRRLDLSENTVRFLPSGALCSLPNLVELNLSKNEIGSISDLSLTDPNGQAGICLRNLKSLDLSSNEIGAVTGTQLQGWQQLQKFNLKHNLIRYLDRDVFQLSPDLTTLDISNNQLSTLPAALFSTSKLVHLSLANNSISSISTQTFANQENLQHLDLSGNLLSSAEIKPGLFQGLSSLKELDISQNQIDRLRKKTFWDLDTLETLKLASNKLRELPNKLLRNMQSLKTLVLSKNLLTQVSNEALQGAKQLNQLLLDNNLIEELEDQVFTNLSSVSVLDLSYNNLLQVPKTLRALRNLQSVDLSKNFISELDSLALPQLWRLDISKNKITNVTSSTFNKMVSLQILDISNNNIAEVQRGAFDFNKLLRAIRLDGNGLVEVDNLFQHLPNLTWLNMSNNNIELFDYAMVPRNLLWLDIHKNKIESLGNYFGIVDGILLEHIDAGFNKIGKVGPANVPKNIKSVFLNDNNIVEVAPYTFFEKVQLQKVDMRVNQMESIDRNSLRLSSDILSQPKFYLGGNPIKCDCEMVWFKTVNDKNTIQNFPLVADLESIYCKLLYSRDQTFIPLVDAKQVDFLCSYKTHCFALCHCCDFDACDCEMSCPDNCTCYHDNSWTKNIAECSNQDFNNLPDKLPMDATEIFLDGNDIKFLKSHTFIGRKNLKIMYLNNSNIETVQNNTFNGLPSVTMLHLESNKITKLEGDEFQGLSNLRELYLQDNSISSINNITFQVLKNLEVLFLSGNSIVDFAPWSLVSNPYLVSVKLAENLWSCDCDFVKNFRTWLNKFSSKVYDAELLYCEPQSNFIQEQVIHFLNDNTTTVCQETSLSVSSHVQTKIVNDYLPLLIAILAACAILLISALFAFLYRHELRVWLHYKYGIRFFQRVDTESDNEKIFDAFVTYSAGDDMFVRQVLAPELEHGSSQYKLCLYHRDLPSLHSYVADTIVQATEASRRTVIILSENFLKQEWSRYDYKSGLHQALRSAKKRLIIVLLGDLEGRDLDADLRLYLKTNTVLQWGDKLFWQKLKFSLPDTALCALSQSTTLQSYPSTLRYHSPHRYQTTPRYQTNPRQHEHIYQVCT